MGFVYILRNGDTDVVKIGRARDVDARRGQFKTGNPEPLTVIDVIEADHAGSCEAFLHRMYQSRRIRGEFFHLTPTEAEDVGRHARRYLAEHVPAEREAKRLAAVECDPFAREPGERERELHQQLLVAREAKYRLEVECARLENELKIAIGSSEGLEGLVSWRTHTLTRFDEASFRELDPDRHAQFLRPVRQRTFRLLWS